MLSDRLVYHSDSDFPQIIQPHCIYRDYCDSILRCTSLTIKNYQYERDLLVKVKMCIYTLQQLNAI